MKISATLLLFFIFSSTVSSQEKSILFTKNETSRLCDAEVAFNNKPIFKKQTIKISETASLEIAQGLSSYSKNGMKIASNVMCQLLLGTSYTGDKKEWAKYIANALEGVKKSKATEIRLELIGKEKSLFPVSDNNKEFKIFANFGGNKQIISTYAYLDLKHNTLYSYSISGSENVKTLIDNELLRIVKSVQYKK